MLNLSKAKNGLDKGGQFRFQGEREVTVSFAVTNTSSKTIAGYHLMVQVFKDGRSVGTYGHSKHDLAGVGVMGPGRVWPVTLSLDKAQAAGVRQEGVKIAVDYVVFEDVLCWGPDTQKLGRSIREAIRGARAERWRLKMVLKKYGAQKVIEDLERPDPPGAAWM